MLEKVTAWAPAQEEVIDRMARALSEYRISSRLQFLCQRDIVFEVILAPGGIEDVACVANGTFRQLAALDDGIDRDSHV